jgi:hypothetical protein
LIDLMADICPMALPRGWDFKIPSLDICMYIAALTSNRYTSKICKQTFRKILPHALTEF